MSGEWRASGVRSWAALMVRIFPPTFRDGVGRDLRRLLVDQAREARSRGRIALTTFVVANTMRAVRDAAAEWVATPVDGWKKGRGMMPTSGLYALRLAVKGLLRRPGYTLPVLVTLALGIGANTATFTLLNSVVLRPLPYPEADRIVRVFPRNVERDSRGAFSLPDVRDWEARTSTLQALGAYTMLNSDMVFTDGSQALEVETAYVTAGFFQALATQPMLGRVPTEADEFGDNRVVVVSHGFWQQQLGSDPGIVGRTIPLSGEEYAVAGVMPESFDFPSDRVDLWALLTIIPANSTPYHIRGVRLLDVVGRMADGSSVGQVRDELTAVAAGLATEYPESNENLAAAEVVDLRREVVGDAPRALVLLMAAAGLILLVTWANLANLVLARESARASELAVRAALGASRLRRAGLVLTECLLLSAIAGGLGLLLASLVTDVLVSLGDSVLPRAHEIAPDWRVAVFTLAASVVTAVSVAVLASARAGRADLATSIRDSGRGSIGRRSPGLLVVSQVSLSVVLLVGAALVAKSLGSLGAVDVGFEADRLVVAEMTFASNRFPDRDTYLPRFDETLEALATVPGVQAVSSVRRFPFRGAGEGIRWTLPDMPENAEGVRANLLQVSPGLFATMGIPILEGGDFQAADVASGRAVMVVSRSVAQAAFLQGGAIGRELVYAGTTYEVVGVVGDIRQTDLTSDPSGVVYVPNPLSPRRGGAFVLRFEPGATGTLEGVREAVRRLDTDQPITELALASDIVGGELHRQQFLSLLLGVFAALALALCSIGVYGVVAFGVSRRRREVGIRLALGAEPRGVRSLVVTEGMKPVLLGIALGVGLSLLASSVVEQILFGVGRFDPVAYAATVSALVVVGLAASWIPARRAAAGSAVIALAGDGG